MTNWSVTEGVPYPLGVSWIAHERAFNFALSSKRALSVTLLLYREEDVLNPVVTHCFDPIHNRSGRVWHCRIKEADLKGATLYAYSVSGPEPRNPYEWHAFDPQKILLDPYVGSIYMPKSFSRQAAVDFGPNAGRALLGMIPEHEPSFDWDGDRHPYHESDMIIYEMHVRGFTRSPNSGVDEAHRGSFSGVIDKIPYLKDLGVTAVELMPVYQHGPQEDNYWGYMPLSFFAVHPEYSSRTHPAEQKREFKEMVKALHDADIEVILDVVYNHTAESDQNGPTYNYKGIDNVAYYILSPDSQVPYVNYSGTGNSLKMSSPEVRQLVVDSMRYWVNEMHVDGFRFDLASVGVRNPDGSINPDPPLAGEIRAVSELEVARHIVEPWDLGVGGYLLGKAFPGGPAWQWNGQFRDEIRRFMRGDPGQVGPLMTRMYGSDDLFPDGLPYGFHPYQSINYVASHDGFTLYDLVSYNGRHNWANGHNNTDGPSNCYSWNHGWEGDDGVPADIFELRKRQVKNFCTLLLLSNGTPMFRAGDEFLQTQFGNNNPYNQDNATSWLNWDRLEQFADVHRFWKGMIAFRKSHPSIARSRYWREDVKWYGPGGNVDFSDDSRQLAYCLRGASQRDDDLYVLINAFWEPHDFTIQVPGPWRRVVDTMRDSPDDFRAPGDEPLLDSPRYHLGARSVVVLLHRRGETLPSPADVNVPRKPIPGVS